MRMGLGSSSSGGIAREVGDIGGVGVALIERRSSRVRVLSRFVGQKRIREAFLASPKPKTQSEGSLVSRDGSGDWTTADTEVETEAEQGQLDNGAEQIDFRKLIPKMP